MKPSTKRKLKLFAALSVNLVIATLYGAFLILSIFSPHLFLMGLFPVATAFLSSAVLFPLAITLSSVFLLISLAISLVLLQEIIKPDSFSEFRDGFFNIISENSALTHFKEVTGHDKDYQPTFIERFKVLSQGLRRCFQETFYYFPLFLPFRVMKDSKTLIVMYEDEKMGKETYDSYKSASPYTPLKVDQEKEFTYLRVLSNPILLLQLTILWIETFSLTLSDSVLQLFHPLPLDKIARGLIHGVLGTTYYVLEPIKTAFNLPAFLIEKIIEKVQEKDDYQIYDVDEDLDYVDENLNNDNDEYFPNKSNDNQKSLGIFPSIFSYFSGNTSKKKKVEDNPIDSSTSNCSY